LRDTDRFRSSRWLDPKQAMLILGIGVAILAILMARAFVSTYSKSFERITVPHALNRTQRFAARALEQAGILDTLTSIARGMTAAQAESLAFQITPQGVGRLDSAALIERSELVLQMLEHDSAQCDAKGTGAPPDTSVGTGIEGLDSASLEKWTQISAEAASAQLRNDSALAEATPKDQLQFGNDLLSQLGDKDFAEWSRIMGDPKKATAAEQCWAQRSMYRAILAMPRGEQLRDLRTMVEMEADARRP
jgi:hypothetical protein